MTRRFSLHDGQMCSRIDDQDHRRTTKDPLRNTKTTGLAGQADICPVRTLANLVSRIQGHGRHPRIADLGINAWADAADDESKYLSSTAVLEQLRTATRAISERRLGFKAEDIGTHSIRSGATMAMYLAGVKVKTIQMIGRWRSRSFMRYLRIQVPETTRGVATRMTSRHTFFTINHGPADARQTQIGGDQVDSQRHGESQVDSQRHGESRPNADDNVKRDAKGRGRKNY